MTEIRKVKPLKTTVTNLDIYVLASELNDVLKDGFISNIYDIPDKRGKTLSLKCRTKVGKRRIIIDPKRRINITQFDYPVPPYPSQFIMAIRKHLKGRRISKVYQYKFDRILVFEIKSSKGKPWKFVIEFFAGGNYILINGEDKTIIANHYKKMRNRQILAKQDYLFPKSRGIDVWNLTKDIFLEFFENKEKGELVRQIARSFNIGGHISEEICFRANIDKKKDLKYISDNEKDLLFKSIQDLIENLKNHKFSPRLILSDKNEIVSFEPMEFKLYSNYKFDLKNSFNQAIDDFYSKIDSNKMFSKDVDKSQNKINKTKKILEKQLEKIEHSKISRKRSLNKGNLIYQYLYPIDKLIETIMTQKREHNLSWKEISSTLEKGKQKGVEDCQIFGRIFEKELKLEVILEGHGFKLDLKKNAVENAEIIYSKAKKAIRKIKGAKIAADNTITKIKKQKMKHEKIEARKAILLRKPKKKWFEKYRWFISSDKFLIIGGRDASSNEIIVKKHMNDNDLFFHTDVRGASVCIIKNDEDLKIPEVTINETAKFASVFSSAWKKGWKNADIFYVHPKQVSKSPKSGEYLGKGSFIINGKKIFLTKPYLNIAIGVKLIAVNVPSPKDEISSMKAKVDIHQKPSKDPKKNLTEDGEQIQYYPKIIVSPQSAMKIQTKNYVVLNPSKKRSKTSNLAKKILGILVHNAPNEAKKWIRLVSIDDIIRVIPPGNGEISK